jgi:sigma-54 dependent transcriptional regulator, acetoin dehydrogenase operon transcriptional activator AcoR
MLERAAARRQHDAWHRFCSAGEISAEVVRDDVARSWMRCRSTGLHPHAPKAPVRLAAAELADLRRRNRRYLEAAAPFMRSPPQPVRDSGFLVVLTDASGIVLELYGPAETLSRAKANNYMAGCGRSEAVSGTNAIGMATIERRPVQLFGAEHYNVHHHGWACAAAPVFAPDGELLGTMTLSGECDNAHFHTLGLAIAAAEGIQARLRETVMEAQVRGSERIARSLLGHLSDPAVTINAAGEIVHLNRPAESLLGVEQTRVGGRKIGSLLSAPQLAELLSGRIDPALFEAAYEINGRRAQVLINPTLIRDEDEASVQGAILSLVRRDQPKRSRGNRPPQSTCYSFDDILGEDAGLLQQIALARTVARHDTRVLITGETGTGKELLAQGIHNASARAAGPFVALNCAAVPRELIESELLGYKDGAFTGAQRGGHVGKIEAADGGTLFLDEISQMPLDMQAKLLRVLQDGLVTRLGDTLPIQVDVRIVAASNENLYERSQQGAFRPDLYFRLSVLEVTLPPLRDRLGDIDLLASAILRRLSLRFPGRAARLSEEAGALMRRYRWPGNIRELENALEMALLLAHDGRILPEHLPARLRESAGAAPQAVEPAAAAPAPAASFLSGATLDDIEMSAIRNALREHGCNISKVSRALGVSRSTLYRKMRKAGLNRLVSLT